VVITKATTSDYVVIQLSNIYTGGIPSHALKKRPHFEIRVVEIRTGSPVGSVE
jgi:hypothetical protein